MRRFISRFLSLLSARNKEFLRDRSALGWNLLFPVIVVFGFAFAFSGGSQDQYKVAVSNPSGLEHPFLKTSFIQFVPVAELAPTLEKLKRHQYDLVLAIDPHQARYWINKDSPKGYLTEKILLGQNGSLALQKQSVEGREIRYVDWLISGLLAMNMMFSALFGVGYVIVRYRKIGVLRRLKATPLHAFEFLLAQVASRLILITVTTVMVFLGCHALLHFQMLGSYGTLFLVLVLGAMCLISLGLLVAARIESEEFAGGLLNLISWPMMFLSGVWFSLEGTHPWMQKLALAFPLTHVIDAARSVMTEGAGLNEIQWHLYMLVGMTAVFLAIGSLAFRWEKAS